MIPDLSGKGLFVFSDPGGAKPLLALITLSKFLTEYKIISDRKYAFFSDFGLDVEQYLPGEEYTIFENFKPNFLFTGTSYTSKIELMFVNEAKKKNTISYSFIDHYTNFEERFLLNKNYIFPDNICVIDQKAMDIGFNTCLPRHSFLITGNFYHTWLQGWKPIIDKDTFFTSLNIPSGNKLIVFAPDPLSNVGGVEKYGLDEASVFQNIIKVLDEQDNKAYTLLIKMHPNQNKDILNNIIPQSDSRFIIAEDAIDINSLLYYSDMVVGIFSNILVESAVMNKNILRCLIGCRYADPLASNNIGTVVHNVEELKNSFSLILN